MTSLRLCVLLFSFGTLMVGCSHPASKNASPNDNSLNALKKLDQHANQGAEVNALRFIALRDTGLSLGARAGLAARAKEINKAVDQYEPVLSRIFNFTPLMLEDNVVPPVLVQGRYSLALERDAMQSLLLLREANPSQFAQALTNLGIDATQIQDALGASQQALPTIIGSLQLESNQIDQNALKVADRNYQIVSQAHFATTPPIWQDYLHLSYDPPETPDKSLLPKDKIEKKIWDQYIQEGWQAGLEQGSLIFTENLGRLKRDFTGMVLYRSLLAQNIVSRPFVAKIDLGITGSGSDMSINERILRITALPQLQLDGQQWKTDLATLPE